MPAPFHLIDGYNLLHAAGMARHKYGPGDLERARNRLLNYLVARLSAAERTRTTIVFDAGDAPPGAVRHSAVKEMQVVFAKVGGDADSLIEELIIAHSAPRQLCVVSSDHRLQKAARRRRASSIDSEEFFDRLEHRESSEQNSTSADVDPSKTDPKFKGAITPEETQEWMRIFGEIPEAAELNDGMKRLQAEIDEIAEKDDVE